MSPDGFRLPETRGSFPGASWTCRFLIRSREPLQNVVEAPPGLQGTRTGCNTHRSRKGRQPFLFAVPGRISGRIPGRAAPFRRPDHSLQKYVPSIARHFLPSPFVAIVPTFSSEPKPHGTPGAQNTRNTDHIPSPPAATPGNFFPVIPTDMTSSLSPRTFRPAEHHASRMPGVLSATAVLLTLCLSACGGGGSGSSAPDSQGAGKGTTPPLSVNPGQPDTGNNSGDGNDGGNAGGSGNTVTPPDAQTPPTSTPPTSAPPASTPPASTPPASTPPASAPPASTPQRNSPPVNSTPDYSHRDSSDPTKNQ